MSYLYNGVFGLLTTLAFGTLTSLISRKLIDNSNADDDYIDPNLFVPPLAKKVRHHLENSMKLVTVSYPLLFTNLYICAKTFFLA